MVRKYMIISCRSRYIEDMYADFLTSLNLNIPPELFTYVEALENLHNTPLNVLSCESEWITYWITPHPERTPRLRELPASYDEDDPDYMIPPIDNAFYRYTWATCFEAYLRRQLALAYNYVALHNITTSNGECIIHEMTLPVPVLNSESLDPDDIRQEKVIIRKYKTKNRFVRRATPIDYAHLTWNHVDAHKTNCSIPLPPKFRCRPALISSMDCMQMLERSTETANENVLTKVMCLLRPFRFVLPLTFLFDIFGDFDSAVELEFPEKPVQFHFLNANVLADKMERKWIQTFRTIIQTKFMTMAQIAMMASRRTNSCLLGGCASYALGEVTRFNYLNIGIEYDSTLYDFFIRQFVTLNDGKEVRVWLTNAYKKVMGCDIRNFTYNGKIFEPSNKHRPDFYVVPDPINFFENRKFTALRIDTIFTLNPDIPIVQHWKIKYNHLPRIILFRPKLELNNYNILKLMSGFDLPIRRTAIVFGHASAFHLRKHILNTLYGFAEIERNEKIKKFSENWEAEEMNEKGRKWLKIQRLKKSIQPNIRATEYIERCQRIMNGKYNEEYMKKQRQMLIIKWPYGTKPIQNLRKNKIFEEIDTTSFKDYLNRLPEKIYDYDGNESLPMEVMSLRYLAYMKLMSTIDNINHNCLCHFNFAFKYESDDNNDNDGAGPSNEKTRVQLENRYSHRCEPIAGPSSKISKK